MLDKGDQTKYRTESGGGYGGGGGGGGADADRVMDCISSVVEDICHDINISIDLLREPSTTRRSKRSISPAARPAPIGLPETLERTVQKPVNRWNPPPVLRTRAAPRPPRQELQDNPTQAAIALGLAARIVE